MSPTTDPNEILAALAAPFGLLDLKCKPGPVSGTRAMAIFYIDARAIQDRLDEVMGVAGWADDFDVLPDHSVMCRLKLRIGGEWIVKCDVGGQSEQPDEGDRCKAAFSDALKRAAVKFGVARYLYRVPPQWCDYDAQKKRFVGTPTLPGMVTRPVTETRLAAAPKPAAVAQAPAAVVVPVTPRPISAAPPTTPAELAARLATFGAALIKSGLCQDVDELIEFVRVQLSAGVIKLAADPTQWPPNRIEQAMVEARRFQDLRRAAKKAGAKVSAGDNDPNGVDGRPSAPAPLAVLAQKGGGR